MKILPSEIWFHIFSNVPFNDKLEYLRVSKQWYEWILQSPLYGELQFRDNEEKLEKAMTFFEKHKNIAKTVLKIKIEECKNSYKFIDQLSQLFPNTREFIFYDFTTAATTTNKPIFCNWKYIQHVKLIEPKEYKTLLADTFLCQPYPFLTSLYIDFYYAHGYNNEWGPVYVERKRNLINNLSNAPHLETLVLDCMHVTMKDLERLHEQVPTLKSLTLNQVTLRLDDTLEYPFSNEPDLSNNTTGQYVVRNPKPIELQMLAVHFFYNSMLEFQDQRIALVWLEYLLNKYTLLESFVFNCATGIFEHDEYEPDPFQEHILQLFSNNPTLASYEMKYCPMTSTITDAMDKSGIRLKQVTLYTKMNNLNSQCIALANSEQRKYIQQVTIRSGDVISDEFMETRPNLEDLTIHSGILISQPFQSFEQLTHLHVHGDYNTINLTCLSQYLKDLTNLVSISLFNVFILNNHDTLAVHFNTSRIKHIKIEQLSICSVTSLYTINNYFKKIFPYCPDLETISLSTYFYISYGYGEELLMPYSLILDLKIQTKLKSIQLTENHSQWYHITSKNHNGYYLHEGNQFIEINDYKPTEYLTTLLVNKSVYINGCKI